MTIRRLSAYLATIAALVAVLLVTPALVFADWKTVECPNGSNTAIGTASLRSVLCLKNDDAAIDVCVSERSNQTCNGTVATDGAHWKAGQGICVNETSTGFPASAIHYCRGASGTPKLSFKESFQR